MKDFKWVKADGEWKAIYVPIGEGMVDFAAYFKLLKQYGINLPVIIHCEYDLGGAEHGGAKVDDPKVVLKQIQKDLQYVRQAWEQAA